MYNIDYSNKLILKFLSIYLNNSPDAIKKDDILSITSLGYDEAYAYALILSNMLGIDLKDNNYEKYLFNNYFLKMVKEDDVINYINNPYYQLFINNNIKNINYKNWKIKWDKYKAYEAFVSDDMIKDDNGLIIPSISFFNKEFCYPAIYQNNREWMSLKPNEINTMKKDISDAFGNVCVCGLGLGYFAYMTSLKVNVNKITIIEKDSDTIELFKKYLLPKFSYKDKIEIIQTDALLYLKEDTNHDYYYIDLWHDVSDGLPLYKTIKKLEKNNKIYRYWIEQTFKCYL